MFGMPTTADKHTRGRQFALVPWPHTNDPSHGLKSSPTQDRGNRNFHSLCFGRVVQQTTIVAASHWKEIFTLHSLATTMRVE
jgi:hypothetical protein